MHLVDSHFWMEVEARHPNHAKVKAEKALRSLCQWVVFQAVIGINNASSYYVLLDNQPTLEGEPNGQDRRRRDEDGERQ